MHGAEAARGSRSELAIALLLGTALVAVNFATPYQLSPTDQGKQAQYALDLFLNGSWIAPADRALGEAATKPPLYTWLAGGISLLLGRIDEWTVRIPAALSAIGLVAVVFGIGRHFEGPRVALAAAVALATNHHFSKISVLVRPDGLITFLLAAQILVYVRCSQDGNDSRRRIAAVCGLSAAAWLTKGPEGGLASLVILVHLAWRWELRRAWRLALLPAAIGGAAFGLWFAAALGVGGDAVWKAMIEGEALRHVTTARSWNPLYYLPYVPARMMPWAVLFPAVAVLVWREMRAPRRGPAPIGLTLPLTWLGTMLLVFGLLPHKRPDLIYVAEPAAALLLGRLARGDLSWRWPRWVLTATALAGIALFFWERTANSRNAEQFSSAAFGKEARAEAARGGARLVHTGFRNSAPLFHLRIAAPPLDPAEIARIPGPVLIVAPPAFQAGLEAELGPLEWVEAHDAEPGTSDPPRLVLLASQG